MTVNYLCGPEIIEMENEARPVKTVKSVVIGLISTTPTGDVNTLVQCLSEKDVATFDSQFIGFTVPQALDAVYDHDAGTVPVTNVLDPAKHKTTIEGEVATFDKSIGQARLAHPVVANVAVRDSEGSTTHTTNTDYRVSAQAGVLTNLSKATEAGDSVKVNYEYANPLKMIVADIISGVNSTGNRAGMKLSNGNLNPYGHFAKILIASVFRTQKSAAAKLIAIAEKLGAIICIDVPVGTTFAQALAGRGPEGTINFNTSSGRVCLYYPHVKVYDPAASTERLEPLSQRVADLRARVDLNEGYWWPSSNQEILGIISIEHQLSTVIGDPQSEVSLLNEQGIAMVPSSYDSSLRLWNNQTAAWPTATHMRNFENVRRTDDVINESIRYFSQQYTDVPTTQALIDALAESINTCGRKMAGDGAVSGFRCWLDSARSPKMGLTVGHLLLSYKYTPPPSLERLMFETEITSEYLLTLKGGN